jgi:hypothetical protein
MNRWAIAACHPDVGDSPCACKIIEECGWPLPNLWLGVSAENQDCLRERVPLLYRTSAAVRFVSYEPAIGSLDLSDFAACPPCRQCNHPGNILRWPCPWCRGRRFELPDWLIVGDESGHHSRPFRIEWARQAVEHCRELHIPCFVKQLGSVPAVDYYTDDESIREDALEGRHKVLVPAGRGGGFTQWNERDGQPPPGTLLQLKLKNVKGGEMQEWPEDLRVREFPA